MLRAVGITFQRLFATEVEFLGTRLAEGPLARAEGRRSMVEQTLDIQCSLLRIAHFTYPVKRICALQLNMVRRSEDCKRKVTV